jgi:hypothetical protein
MADPIRFRDIEVSLAPDEEGVIIKCRGGSRFVAYEELVELADSEGPVTIR